MEITYIEGNEKDLDLIQPLWEKLRQHHQKKSENFQNHYQNFDFNDRLRRDSAKKQICQRVSLTGLTLQRIPEGQS